MPLDLTWVDDSATVGTTPVSLITGSTTLTESTVGGYFTLVINPVAMAQGDEYLVTLYEKAATGDTQEIVTDWPIVGDQERLHIAPGFPLGIGWDMTIAKIAGTDRTFTWTLRRTS